MTTGRNEPCPCGSGKKHKKCCRQKAPEPSSYMKEKLDRFHERIIANLFRHAEKVFGPEAFEEARAEFFGWPEEGDLEEMLEDHKPLFYPWFLFKWRLDDDDEITLSCPRNQSVAESYLRTAGGKKLAPLEQEYLAAHVRAELSFFEIIGTNPGTSVTIRDLLLDREHLVLEKSASRIMRQGDVFFGSVVEAGGIALLGALGPVPLLPSAKVAILEMREDMAHHAEGRRITPEILYDYDLELRGLYLDLSHARTAMPSLANTDGEKLSFHTLKYAIASPQKVFDALKGLTNGLASEKELLEEAEFDGQGGLVRVEIPWLKQGNAKHGGMENTLHGRILINGREMSCEVNSAERAQRLRALIEERLAPDEARYRTTVIQSAEAMMREEESDAAGSEDRGAHDELMALPEVRARIDEMMRKHWEAWPDMELPALRGRTPRQAAADALGRQMVSAMLEDAERNCLDSNGAMGSPEIFSKIRQELGLEPR